MTAPSIEYGLLSPILIVLAVAVAGVLVEAFLPWRVRYGVQVGLALAGLLGAFGALVTVYSSPEVIVGHAAAVGAVTVDRPALFLQGILLIIAVLSIVLIAERAAPETDTGRSGLSAFTAQASSVPGTVAELVATKAGAMQTEVFPLTMFAVGGMMIFPAAGDLLTMLVALEVFSLPLYLMCGLARHRRLLSQEAALKYFLLGAFSSAIFLYGMAMIYGYAGTLSITGIASAVAGHAADTRLILVGSALVTVGLLFKVSAVPFHAWVPDVYQGAPTPITAFMAAGTKIAAFGALLRLFYVGLPALKDDWRPVLWAIAILTMAVGTITAVTQRDVKRLLGYSAVAHTGFILTGVIALNAAGLSGTLFYLAAYGFTTIGAFALVSVVRGSDGVEQTGIVRWAGLGKRYPVTAAVAALFLLSFAGIPLTSGFISKFAVFKAAAEGGAAPLVVVGVLASAVAAYFYLRVIVAMFFTDPPADAPEIRPPSVMTVAVIAVTLSITFILGMLPQPVLDIADRAGWFFTS